MRIRRLELQGFKSFADKTILRFGEGITGVVGPNGCGKSNIVDAIRWVMGEQSAKHLRGGGMQDVIFAGSESRGPQGFAEVSITFANDGSHAVPQELSECSEIAVTRRLYRDGTSEYALNKTICRLRDIQDLFMGTGIGKNAYSIIEQGRIGVIVTAKPEERRTFIEDAAGISRYKARRKAAERRIESTEQNLLRIRDITSELEQRLKSLERQAKKATRYKRIKEELEHLEVHGAAHRLLGALVQTRHHRRLAEATRVELEQNEARLAEREAALEADRDAAYQNDAELQSRTEALHGRQQALALAQNRAEQAKREVEDCAARIERMTDEDRELQTALRDAKDALEQAERDQGGVAGSREFETQQLRTQEQSLQATEAEHRRLVAVREAHQQTAVDVLTKTAALNGHIGHQERQLAELEGERTEAEKRAETARADEQSALSRRAALNDEVARHQQMSLQLEDESQVLGEQLERLRTERGQTAERTERSRAQLLETQSRLRSLEKIQKEYEGCERGVRAVMQDGARDPAIGPGLRGLLAERLSVAPEFERAVEAALGSVLQCVLVDDRAVSRQAIDRLAADDAGRSSFWALAAPTDAPDTPSLQRISAPVPGRPEWHGASLAAFVQIEAGHEARLAPLLRYIFLAEDLDSAWSLHEQGAPFVVTPQGETIDRHGIITGGSSAAAAGGMLARRREIGELKRSSQALATAVSVADEQLARLDRRIVDLEGSLERLREDRHRGEVELASLEKDIQGADEAARSAKAALAAAQKRLLDLGEREAALKQTLTERRAEVQALEQRHAELTADAADLDRRIEAHAEACAEQRARLTELRVEMAANEERRQGAADRLRGLAARRDELSARMDRVAEAKREAEARHTALEESIGRATAEVGALEQEVQDGQAEVEKRRQAHQAGQEALREAEAAIKVLRQSVAERRETLSQAQLSLRELEIAQDSIREQLGERYRVSESEAIASYHLSAPQSEAHQERAQKLRRQLDNIGAINLTAIEEFEEVQERYSFLSQQQSDLENAIVTLRSAIRRINKTTREQYLEAFELINQKFQQVFPMLFNGGRAAIVMTDESDPLESGIEMLAQPPGKKLQSINLLSGGEKALTAVALIFSIFLIKPTPFCLLDEVDAPLDEANVGRYNKMLQDMSSISQFIIITHNKRTMELPERLYGVTMEEAGISRLVPVDMSRRQLGAA